MRQRGPGKGCKIVLVNIAGAKAPETRPGMVSRGAEKGDRTT